MKSVQTCKKCKLVYDCTNDNEISRTAKEYKDLLKKKEIGFENRIFKCPCGHINNGTINYIPLNIDEAIKVVKSLKKGESNKYIIGNIDLKIGDFKRCKKCNKLNEVVHYDGFFSGDSNTTIICECEEAELETKHWYKPCGDKNCEFHKGIDVEKFDKDHNTFEEQRNICRIIFEKYPPRNDGILELDRIIFMFGNMYGKGNSGDHYLSISDKFMKYCAEHNILTK